ncbi:GntR family transcriptional regulator [Kineothrix sp. MB12-C1]|uniref:GntR family transcriptional regulator n=1 Tax=Kineothrix sp. MB12-C1 TaxID=3070215 RepID=UPI0027D335CC|nr:GntR family transcriptional regulator [Kineothrix sp. MB12-C1]WMC93926.1 GntR family transcriptional regulator [Kineothrix sp. MB12-C1]
MEESRIPKYFVLKKELIQKIEEEEYGPSTLIPSERELMEQYQVSRITVRKAIDELVAGGYLYRIQGKGTYVKNDEVYSQNLFAITSCTEDVIRLGKTPSKKVTVSEVIAADAKRARILNVAANDKLLRLGRITMADGEPLNYTITYLPQKIFPGIEQYDFNEQPLYQLIQNQYHVKFAKSRRTLEAVLTDEEIAEYLDIDEQLPVILFGCVTYGVVNGKEIPIEYFQCYYRTDQYKFYMEQIGDSSSRK